MPGPSVRSLISHARYDRRHGANPAGLLLRYLRHRAAGRHLWLHRRAHLSGVGNITTGGLVSVGVVPGELAAPDDQTVVRAAGRLDFRTGYAIYRGCRVYVGAGATCRLGAGFMNVHTRVVVTHRLEVGEYVFIGWNCTLLDDDVHTLSYPGRADRPAGITIGDRVWIGCNVSVLRGAVIPDGCVVAANAVVNRAFDEPATLLAGNPARVVRRQVRWSR